MKVKIQGFNGTNHSWAIVHHNIARALTKLGHDVHINSTNGYEHFPEDLKELVRHRLDPKYDMQLSYTAMKNFPAYLDHGSKNRFGIWCYEFPILPSGFAKYHHATDKILAPSNFARDIFIKNGVPTDKVVTVPHGINLNDFDNKNKFPLKTNKKYKIFVNIGQPHGRKNIKGMFEAYGEAFTKKDDVCLVAKISGKKKLTAQFEVDVWKIFDDFKKKYPNHAEIELITDYIPNIVELYSACDIVYTLSYSEGFYLPGLEGLAAGKLNVAPRYGGQLDFLNDSNSLLIEGKIIRAEPKMQYWSSSIYNSVFESNCKDAANKLQQAISNYDELVEKSKTNTVIYDYTWEKVAEQIIGLTI